MKILYGAKERSSRVRSVVTPPKVNRFGWNLEQCWGLALADFERYPSSSDSLKGIRSVICRLPCYLFSVSNSVCFCSIYPRLGRTSTAAYVLLVLIRDCNVGYRTLPKIRVNTFLVRSAQPSERLCIVPVQCPCLAFSTPMPHFHVPHFPYLHFGLCHIFMSRIFSRPERDTNKLRTAQAHRLHAIYIIWSILRIVSANSVNTYFCHTSTFLVYTNFERLLLCTRSRVTRVQNLPIFTRAELTTRVIAIIACLCVCLSMCVSVTRRYCITRTHQEMR